MEQSKQWPDEAFISFEPEVLNALYNFAPKILKPMIRKPKLEPITIDEFKALLLPELAEDISDDAITKAYGEIRLLSEYCGRSMQDLTADLNRVHIDYFKFEKENQ